MSATGIVLKFAPTAQSRVKVDIRSPHPDSEVEYTLEAPALGAALLDALQRGTLTAVERQAIETAVTAWLLGAPTGNGVSQTLKQLIKKFDPHRPALTFTYPRDVPPELLLLPLELIQMENAPLALFGALRSIVHELEPFIPPVATTSGEWPFRILLFRAGPNGLDTVPPVLPIQQALIAGLGVHANRVRIEVVTSETPGSPPSTFERFLEPIRKFRPHAAVFLGHGMLDGNKGYLAFENPAHEIAPIAADALRTQLQNGPTSDAVPLLILIGCLTAAGSAATVSAGTSNPTAFLGIAQELIQSSLGVASSIGMRARIDGADATAFLNTFFKELVTGTSPGDVGAAVKSARLRLHATSPTSLAPFAPMLMQTVGAPPPLAFLQRPFRPVRDEVLLEKRRRVWAGMAGLRAAGAAMDPLEPIRVEFDANATNAPGSIVLWPRFTVSQGTSATVPIDLSQDAVLEELRFQVWLPQGVRVASVRRPASTKDFRLFVSYDVPQAVEILLCAETATAIVAGPVVELDLSLDPLAGAYRELGVTFVSSTPVVAGLGESNVIV